MEHAISQWMENEEQQIQALCTIEVIPCSAESSAGCEIFSSLNVAGNLLQRLSRRLGFTAQHVRIQICYDESEAGACSQRSV